MSLNQRFIAIEGVDGSGKTTQAARLYRAMIASGYDVILTREPGGSPGAEEIRSLLVEGEPDRWNSMTELLLMYAARCEHLVDTVWPALRAGKWVICDRFADSSRAFQGVAGALGMDAVDTLHELVAGTFDPALCIVLDVDPAVSLERARGRGGREDRFEQKGIAYHRAVRRGFELVVERAPDTHVMVDASAGMDEVTQLLRDILRERLGINLGVVPA